MASSHYWISLIWIKASLDEIHSFIGISCYKYVYVCQYVPICFSGADKELGSIGVRSGIGHGQDSLKFNKLLSS